MPIITVQRRMAEQGRIRLGQKVATRNNKTRPEKLDRFRFTSSNQGLIEQIADAYGGQAREWDNAGKREFEVISDARAIPVIVVKGGFSQWHEAWSKAGLQHRCDGEKDPAGVYCDPEDPAHLEAIEKPTTRLSVMLSEIETLGTWRMESKGWNAAAELPSMAELAMHVGDYVPATLSLAERSSIIETSRGPQTSRFVVPVLDLRVTKARLVEIAGGAAEGTPAIRGLATQQQQLEAPVAYAVAVADATSVEELRLLWHAAGERRQLSPELQTAINARVAELEAPEAGERSEDADAPPEPDTAAPVSGSTPADRDQAWQMLVALADGDYDIGLTNLRVLLEAEYAQPVADLDAEQLTAFGAKLHSGMDGAA